MIPSRRPCVVALAAALLAFPSCQWEVPNGPFADGSLDDSTGIQLYTVGGQVTGLWTGANLQLRLAAMGQVAEIAAVTQEGNFAFAGQVPTGTMFSFSVESQPSQHDCTVQTATGTVTSANPLCQRS